MRRFLCQISSAMSKIDSENWSKYSVDSFGDKSEFSKQLNSVNITTQMSIFVSKQATIRIEWAICCQSVRNFAMRFAMPGRIHLRRRSVNLGCLLCSQTGLLLARSLFWWRSLFCYLNLALPMFLLRQAQVDHQVIAHQKTKRPATNSTDLNEPQFRAVAI